ncbi:DUF5678 domain-containing protein [Anaerolineales bacterium HSG24]|nr:DUF5678 domain-containing protein [Anaerolineales bacterium HSG24]
MEAIMVNREVWQRLEQDAQEESRPVTELVHEALEQYLHQRQLAKIKREISAYQQLHPKLREKHLGQWVAIHNQTLVDYDDERVNLYRRIRAKYGQTAILIRQVMEHPTPEIRVRTRSYGKREIS